MGYLALPRNPPPPEPPPPSRETVALLFMVLLCSLIALHYVALHCMAVLQCYGLRRPALVDEGRLSLGRACSPQRTLLPALVDLGRPFGAPQIESACVGRGVGGWVGGWGRGCSPLPGVLVLPISLPLAFHLSLLFARPSSDNLCWCPGCGDLAYSRMDMHAPHAPSHTPHLQPLLQPRR